MYTIVCCVPSMKIATNYYTFICGWRFLMSEWACEHGNMRKLCVGANGKLKRCKENSNNESMNKWKE